MRGYCQFARVWGAIGNRSQRFRSDFFCPCSSALRIVVLELAQGSDAIVDLVNIDHQ